MRASVCLKHPGVEVGTAFGKMSTPAESTLTHTSMAPNGHIKIRILPTMISSIPTMLGPGTRMSDPYVYVVFWAPNKGPRATNLLACTRKKNLQTRVVQQTAKNEAPHGPAPARSSAPRSKDTSNIHRQRNLLKGSSQEAKGALRCAL